MKGVLMNSVAENYNVKSSYSQLAFKATQPGASRIDKAIKEAAAKLDDNAINKIKEAFGGGPYVTFIVKRLKNVQLKIKKLYKNNLLKNSGKV